MGRSRTWLAVGALAVVGVLVVSGCSKGEETGITDGPGPMSASGTLTLRSGSVPDPYNWSKTAQIKGSEVTITTHGWKNKDRSEPSQPLVRTCTATLDQGPAKDLANRLGQLATMKPTDGMSVGGEYVLVELSSGQQQVRWSANKRDNPAEFQAVQEAYAAAAAACTPVEGGAAGGPTDGPTGGPTDGATDGPGVGAVPGGAPS